MIKKKKEVLVIFKTHLDIGFTDYAENIKQRYIREYIPNAIKVGYELLDTNTPFVWTTGAWLIWEALKVDDGTLEKAIKDGIIRWHGLPFTTHTELMSKKLFEYGISISKRLDQRFGMNTIAAKMTDVPGHTIGMVPLLEKAGIEFLHIGVNAATPVPPVPKIFRWKCNGSEVVVMYENDYGKCTEFDDCVIFFAHTGDNRGPQSSADIIEVYDYIHECYPDCIVKAASLDDVAIRLRNLKDTLPVVENEIGDTWIHGAGTDPKKMGLFRKLLRDFESLKDTDNVDVYDSLLLVPEHTCGLDVKTFFHYDEAYELKEFEKYTYNPDRIKIESSWEEQRKYLDNAADTMNIELNYEVKRPELSDAKRIDISSVCPNFRISWQLFDNRDYERYKNMYMTLTPENESWALWDFTKVGLDEYEGGIFDPFITDVYKINDTLIYALAFDEKIKNQFGLPDFFVEVTECDCTSIVEVKWFDKKPLRMPNAFWMKFTGYNERWQIEKLGQWISPSDICGSPLISGVGLGIRNSEVTIMSDDAAIVAPFGRRLLEYDLHPKQQDMYFNLYNNIWNTNFPMWYSDDSKFRFRILSNNDI